MSSSKEIYTFSQDSAFFSCELCNKLFKNQSGLKIHKSKAHTSTPENTNPSSSELTSVLPSTSNGNTEIASKLGRYFRPQYKYSSDDETDSMCSPSHRNKTLDVTSTCKNSSTSTNPVCSKFICDICNNSFKNSNGLKIHRGKKHPSSALSRRLESLVSNEDISGPQNGSSSDPIYLCELLSSLKHSVPILKRIPRGARNSIAVELTAVLLSCSHNNSPLNWLRLFIFPFAVLRIPNKLKTNPKSLTALVKENLSLWKQNADISPDVFAKTHILSNKAKSKNQEKKFKTNLTKKVESKLSDGDIRGAVRLLCSEDSLAQPNEDTFLQLQKKHPQAPSYQNFPDPPEGIVVPTCTSSEIHRAIRSFLPGSAGGLDSLTPQHLKDLTTDELGTVCTKLLSALSAICDTMLNGRVPENISQLLYGASLCALNKKDGGIRPIAVGCTLRRLVAKIICHRIMEPVGNFLRPHQFGFASKSGAEAVVHSARKYISHPHRSTKVILKIDFFNAFNLVSRDVVLSRVKESFPEFFHFVNQIYRSPKLLSFRDKILLSQRGVQQGDPLGPVLFCLALHPLITSLKSEFNCWYLDDGTLADNSDTVFEDLQQIIAGSQALGLSLNNSKCEITVLSDDPEILNVTLKKFDQIAPGIKPVQSAKITLLGCPLSVPGISEALNSKLEVLQRFSNNLKELNSHCGYFLLKHSFGIPRVTYLLRCAPCWKEPELLAQYDSCIRNTLETICNCKLDEISWRQSSLPVGVGGLGVRDISTLCYSAFLGSLSSVTELLNSVLPHHMSEPPDKFFEEALLKWSVLSKLDPLKSPVPDSQKKLDVLVCQNSFIELLSGAQEPLHKARLLAAHEKESGAWLNTLPSAPLGTLLDNSSFRIAVSLRIGQPVCEPHNCNSCGESVDILGYHGLSCRKSTGRWSRHAAINDILKRALTSAEIPSVLEPPGCCRNDGKKADGMTLIPWHGGRALLWDATCRDTMADSYIASTSRKAGEAARLGEIQKRGKYSELESRFIFIPFAVETFGAWGSDAKNLIKCIGRMIRGVTNEVKSTAYLIQRISIAIQRGNAASVMGTIPPSSSLGEIFYV